MNDDDDRLVLEPDSTGPGMHRIVEEYVGPLLPAGLSVPLRRASRKPKRGRAEYGDKETLA